MVVTVVVRWNSGPRKNLDLCDNEEQLKTITVRQLKEKIIAIFDYKGHEKDLRLLFMDKCLMDERLLSDYNTKHMTEFNVIPRVMQEQQPARKGDGGMGDREGKNRSRDELIPF